MGEPAENPGDVKLNIGMLGNIKKVTVKRGTTVGEALQQFGSATILRNTKFEAGHREATRAGNSERTISLRWI